MWSGWSGSLGNSRGICSKNSKIIFKDSVILFILPRSCLQVVESDTSTFALDKKKNPKEVDSIIVQSIEKLLGRDDPALEMYRKVFIYSIAIHIMHKFVQD